MLGEGKMLINLLKESCGRGWQEHRSFFLVVITTLVTQLAGCATTPLQNARYWKIEACSGGPTPNVRFTRADNSTLAIVPRVSCETVVGAAGKISAVANYRADQIFIADPDVPNAFATLNKEQRPIIVVTMGMLSALGSDEAAWAGLLGHEIAHHVRNHGAGRKNAQAEAQAGGNAVANILGALIPGVGGFVAGTVGGTTTNMALYGNFTRPQEREADELGLQWMVAAGYDPRGMERLFDMLGKHSAGLPGFLSTHPGAEDRAKMVQDFIATAARKTEPATNSEKRP
jgi:predicted Zn-dependent protease